jgi:tetratricopeptide (TPR) repeat protein
VPSEKKNRTRPPKANNRPVIKPSTLPAGHTLPRAWFVAAALALSIGTVYGPALTAPLIFDDVDTITRNDSITAIWPLFGSEAHRGPLNPPPNVPTSARPLVNLSFAINYQFSQLHPAGYHAANAIIHFLTAMLLWAIVRRTLRLPYFAGRFEAVAGWLAFAVALIWALHPLQTEAVIYATQRTELMMALFYLATVYCSLRYWASTSHEPQRKAWLTLAVFACLAGMASKEVMVSAPLIVLLFDRAFITGSLAGALRKSWPLYAGLAATWILLVGLSLGSPHGGAAGFQLGPPAYVWWATQAKIFWLYLKLAIWPWPLLIHYQLPYVSTFSEALLYVIPLVLLGVATLWMLWRNRPVGLLGTWYFAILSPTFLIPVITEMAAERRMYLPLAALVILFVVGGYRLAILYLPLKANFGPTFDIRFLPFMALLFLLAMVCGVISATRLSVYQQPSRLWQQVLRVQPQNDTAHQQLGKYLNDAGDTEAAIAHFREAVRLNPGSSRARYNLGVLLFKTKAINDAVAQFSEGARLSPDDVQILLNLSGTLTLVGRNDEALKVVDAALQLSPDDWMLHNNRGDALKNLSRNPESIQAFQEALRLNPMALELYNDIADNYFQMKKPEQAIAALERGLKLATADADRAKIERFSRRIREKR